jgi:hypothetical protein
MPDTRFGRGSKWQRGAYRSTSLVSTVMLPGIEPVNPFLAKYLITHTHAAACNTLLAQGESRSGAARHAPHLRDSGKAWGTHMEVSAVSAEIVGGTLPTRPG